MSVHMENKVCNCFIRHVVTEQERKETTKQLEYSRSIGDNVGVLVAMASLAGCPPHTLRTRG